MKKLFLFAALAAAAMTSCSKENGNKDGASSENPITMRALVDKTGSRAAAMTTARFTSFHVKASRDDLQDLQYLNTAVYKIANAHSDWSYAPRAYYPADGTTLSFYAYAPIGDVNMTTELQQSGGLVSFDYTVPADQSSDLAEDLLISSVLNKASGDVAYTFNHALSAATFTAQNKNEDESELVYVIKSIEITELYNEGTFTYDNSTDGTGTWSTTGPQLSYVAPIPQSGVALEPTGTSVPVGSGKALLTNNDFLILLPQTVSNWGDASNPMAGGTFVKVVFSVRDGGGNYIYEDEGRYLEIPMSSTLYSSGFEAGMRYDFTFSFDAFDAITMDVTGVTGWSSTSTDL